MAQHFFVSRRAFHKGQFTNNFSKSSRYYQFDDGTDYQTTLGKFADPAAWAKAVVQKANARGGDVVIFVHGYNTGQGDMVDRMLKIDKGLKASGYPCVVVGFDWPSDGTAIFGSSDKDKNVLLAYKRDRADAKRSAQVFMPDVLSLLLDKLSNRQRINIIAHSMGAYLVTRSFERSSAVFGANWSIDEAAFIAADTDQDEMEDLNSYATDIVKKTKRFTNFFSGYDDTLKIGQGFVNGGRRRLGEAGLPSLAHPELFDVDCGSLYKRKYGTLFDLKRSHTWYFDDPEFYKDLGNTLGGKSSALRRVL